MSQRVKQKNHTYQGIYVWSIELHQHPDTTTISIRYWSRWWTVTIRFRFSQQLSTPVRGWTFPHGLLEHPNTHFHPPATWKIQSVPLNTMPKMPEDMPHTSSKNIKGHQQLHKQPKTNHKRLSNVSTNGSTIMHIPITNPQNSSFTKTTCTS